MNDLTLLNWLGIGLAAVSAVAGAWTLRTAWRNRSDQGAAFRRVGRRLGLTFAERRMVRAIARHAGLPGPAPLLISRGCFDRAAHRFRSRDPRQVGRLRRRIFE